MATEPTLLSPEDLQNRLDALEGWNLDGTSITRTYRFADFAAAFGFMSSVALSAERLNHHPDWSNEYSRVTVRLTTHDAGGLTALDFDLAAIMDDVASGLS